MKSVGLTEKSIRHLAAIWVAETPYSSPLASKLQGNVTILWAGLELARKRLGPSRNLLSNVRLMYVHGLPVRIYLDWEHTRTFLVRIGRT